MSRFVKLSEVDDAEEMKPKLFIHVTKECDNINVRHHVNQQPELDEPMEAFEKPVTDVKMDDVENTPSVVVPQLLPPKRPVKNRLELAEYQTHFHEQQGDLLVFQPEVRRRREPMSMLGNGQEY